MGSRRGGWGRELLFTSLELRDSGLQGFWEAPNLRYKPSQPETAGIDVYYYFRAPYGVVALLIL